MDPAPFLGVLVASAVAGVKVPGLPAADQPLAEEMHRLAIDSKAMGGGRVPMAREFYEVTRKLGGNRRGIPEGAVLGLCDRYYLLTPSCAGGT